MSAEKAAAWDEGYEAAQETNPHVARSDNPYRHHDCSCGFEGLASDDEVERALFGHCEVCGARRTTQIVENPDGPRPQAVGLVCSANPSHGPCGPVLGYLYEPDWGNEQ